MDNEIFIQSMHRENELLLNKVEEANDSKEEIRQKLKKNLDEGYEECLKEEVTLFSHYLVRKNEKRVSKKV